MSAQSYSEISKRVESTFGHKNAKLFEKAISLAVAKTYGFEEYHQSSNPQSIRYITPEMIPIFHGAIIILRNTTPQDTQMPLHELKSENIRFLQIKLLACVIMYYLNTH